MIRLLLDQGIPRSSVALLSAASWDVVHVYDIGLARATDREILNRARDEHRTCVTLDADFHTLIAVANAPGPSVIRIRQEGLKGKELAELLLRIWPLVESQLQQGALVSVTEKLIRVRLLPVTKKPR